MVWVRCKVKVRGWEMGNSAYGCVPFPFSIFPVKLGVPQGGGAIVMLQLVLALLMRLLYCTQFKTLFITINDAKMCM